MGENCRKGSHNQEDDGVDCAYTAVSGVAAIRGGDEGDVHEADCITDG